MNARDTGKCAVQGRQKVKLSDLFSEFRLEKVRFSLPFLAVEIAFDQVDRDAAWELYVEMLTRIVTQPLPA